MPRRRVAARPKMPLDKPNALQSQLQLLTYAFSRLPPRQLPLLAVYAYSVLYACNRGWISRETAGKGGAAVVGVLSMVTGLLLSYRFSSAVAKWDEGKKVWVEVRTAIRDGVRLVSVSTQPPQLRTSSFDTSSTPEDLGDTSTEEDGISDVASPTPALTSNGHAMMSTPVNEKGKGKARSPLTEREDELSGLMVGFAFALQHHLHRTRPLPQPPLCDLLPPPYLSSLKRTEARVRFADSHAGPSRTPKYTSDSLGYGSDPFDSGIRKRDPSPTTPEGEKSNDGEGNEWDAELIRKQAERLIERLSGSDIDNAELKKRISQTNLSKRQKIYFPPSPSPKPKSNLAPPHPNLPLALLRLMEGYVVGLAGVSEGKGGWCVAKRERALGIVKALDRNLGDAERLANNPPPLPLTLHSSHLLIIYLAALPCSLLCVLPYSYMIVITMLAGWCLLGLEALIGEVGCVFGQSENHHPLPLFAHQILVESLDVNPGFMRYYRGRLVSRVGEEDEEVVELDRRCRRGGEEWMPSFV